MRISPALIDSRPAMVFEQGRLAAARRADQHQEAALLEREIDALQDLQRAEALAQAR